MEISNWQVQIYSVVDEETVRSLCDLLSRIDDLVVDSVASGPDHFVLVDCPGDDHARWVQELATSDGKATLVDTARTVDTIGRVALTPALLEAT